MSPENTSQIRTSEHQAGFPDTDIFPQEFREWLEPGTEIIHQTALGLINTRLFIDQINREKGRTISIDEISRSEWAEKLQNYDMVWLMGVFKPSEFSRRHSINYDYQYRDALPDLDPAKDIVGSPYAITDYSPNPFVADDWEKWDKMVDVIHSIDKKVIVDFVPNHTAVDHPWAGTHPEYFIQGTREQFENNPDLYQIVTADDGNTYYLAHGKDPNYPGWADTLQLNYANPDVQDRMEEVVLSLSDHADGLRCDLAMLLNADTFLTTWGGEPDKEGNIHGENHLSSGERDFIRSNNFWERIIPKVKEKVKRDREKNFIFIAEAYWEKEELGRNFDYIYNSDFYRHLERIIKESRPTDPDFYNHLRYLFTTNNDGRNYSDLNYIENHDEPRSVTNFGEDAAKAASVVTALLPDSIFLLLDGQEKGNRIKPPVQISRTPNETPDPDIERFYDRLLKLKRSRLFQEGKWSMADVNTYDTNLIVYQVSVKQNESDSEIGAIICVNLGRNSGGTKIPVVSKDTNALVYRLVKGDIVSNPDNVREGGMYIELIPWESQIIFYKK